MATENEFETGIETEFEAERARRRLPVWLTGMGNAANGLLASLIGIVVPILLAADGVSVARIALVITVVNTPQVWFFLMSPVMDVGLNRRRYVILTSLLSALLTTAGMMSLHHLEVAVPVLLLAMLSIVMSRGAFLPWLSELVSDAEFNQAGAWQQVANVGIVTGFATLAVWVIRQTPSMPAALGILIPLALAPVAIPLLLPDDPKPERPAREVFRVFWRDVKTIAKRKPVQWAGLVYLCPAGAFGLVALSPGLGREYHTAERWVAMLTGLGGGAASSAGCLLAIWICGRWASRRTTYLGAGVAAGVLAAAMIALPKTTLVFVGGFLLYNVLQGINYAAFTALAMETVPRASALRATQMSFLTCLSNAPILFMNAMDGVGSKYGGTNGMLGMDAALSIGTGLGLMAFFRARERKA